MLSEVPLGWQQVPFDELAKLQSGFAFKSEQFSDDAQAGLPIIRIRDLSKQTPTKFYAGSVPEEYKVNVGDILIGMDGQFDCVVWQEGEAALNQRLLRVFSTERSNKKYLHYMLHPILKKLESQISGTTVKHLSTRNLKTLTLPLPPLSEQKRIAEVLSNVDANIQAAQRLTEQTELVKQGLMEELLTGGLGGKSIERGDVPNGWSKRSLADVALLERGKFSARPRNDPKFYGGLIPFIQTGDVSNAIKYVNSAKQTLNDKGLKVSRLFSAGKILMSIAANVGNVAILTFDSAMPDSVIAITENEHMNRDYLYYFLAHSHQNLKALASQNAQANLNLEKLNKFMVVFPNSIDEQRHIAEFISSFDEKISANRKIFEHLQRIKVGLMDDLLTGKVRTV